MDTSINAAAAKAIKSTAISTLALLVIVFAAPAGATTKEEFLSKIVGKTWKLEMPGGFRGTIRFNRGGDTRIKGENNSVKYDDRGRWWFRGNTYCSKYVKHRGGKISCGPLPKETAPNRYRGAKGGVMYR